jgi:dihydrolipoyl dehydrogenase
MNEFDIAIIGAGPGGYVAAIRCAQLGFKTICVDKGKTLGGTCLNIGCIPSKCLLYSSYLYDDALNNFSLHGINIKNLSLDFVKMMQRKSNVVKTFTDGIDFLFKKNKVTKLHGSAKFINSSCIQVVNEKIHAKKIIIATGSKPIEIPFLPFDEKQIVSSTGALEFSEVPKDLLIVGAGIIGVEIGSIFARLKTKVTFIELMDRVCPNFDCSLSNEALKILQHQNMEFFLSHKVINAKKDANKIILSIEGRENKTLSAEKVLVCVGRVPNIDELQLGNIKVEINTKKQIKVNNNFQTNIANIYAIGDCIDGPMLAHKAMEEGYMLAEHLAGNLAHICYTAIPNVAYTSPEIASVGFTEEYLKNKQISYKCFSYPFKANSRAKCTTKENGFVKIIINKSKHILGVHMIGDHVSEIISEAVLCIQKKIKVDELAKTPHAHPTLSEAVKEAALGAYQRPIHI